jgi:hypothetical protein
MRDVMSVLFPVRVLDHVSRWTPRPYPMTHSARGLWMMSTTAR